MRVGKGRMAPTRKAPVKTLRKRRRVIRAGIHCHPYPVVSVIIPVMNERYLLPAVIREAAKVYPQTEVIVVANGCTDDSAALARRLGARVLEYPDPLGHDVPRAIGAGQAKGEVLLFIDADMVIPASELRPFVREINAGSDIALNSYGGPVQTLDVHPVVSAKYMLNSLLGRADLQGASMTAVPHAIRRSAAERIGVDLLAKPPLAQAAAMLAGLKTSRAHYIDVGRLNRRRNRPGRPDVLAPLIAGDHMEAIGLILAKLGPRGGLPDLDRLRERAR